MLIRLAADPLSHRLCRAAGDLVVGPCDHVIGALVAFRAYSVRQSDGLRANRISLLFGTCDNAVGPGLRLTQRFGSGRIEAFPSFVDLLLDGLSRRLLRLLANRGNCFAETEVDRRVRDRAGDANGDTDRVGRGEVEASAAGSLCEILDEPIGCIAQHASRHG
ncbi:MAG: hypothetical protein ACRELX_00885, partial [Longimicrobiales bacterium]